MAYVKVNRRPARYTAVRTPYERRVHSVANSYAAHMGVKFSLSPSEVRRDVSETYARAMKDSSYRRRLFDQYG